VLAGPSKQIGVGVGEQDKVPLKMNITQPNRHQIKNEWNSTLCKM